MSLITRLFSASLHSITSKSLALLTISFPHLEFLPYCPPVSPYLSAETAQGLSRSKSPNRLLRARPNGSFYLNALGLSATEDPADSTLFKHSSLRFCGLHGFWFSSCLDHTSPVAGFSSPAACCISRPWSSTLSPLSTLSLRQCHGAKLHLCDSQI